jgi:predicted ATP-grasp superfamily ATP-dependent carboligase
VRIKVISAWLLLQNINLKTSMTAHGNVNGIYLQNTSIYNYLNSLDANYTYATFASSGSNYGITDYPIDGWYEYICFRANHSSNTWKILAIGLVEDSFYIGRIYNNKLLWHKIL